MGKRKKDEHAHKDSLRSVSIRKGSHHPCRVFGCKRKDCSFKSFDYNQLCDHIDKNHWCKKCSCGCKNIFTHKCRKPKDESRIPDVDIKDTTFSIKQKSNKGVIVTLVHEYNKKIILLGEAIQVVHFDLVKLLNKYLLSHKGIRAQISVQAMCTELKTGDQKIKTFHSPFSRLTHHAFIEEIIIFSRDYIDNVIQLLTETGSGIRIEEFINMEVNIGVYNPIRPRGYIKFPKGLRGRHGLVNIKTQNHCFKLSVIASLYSDKIIFQKYSDIEEKDLTSCQKKYFKRQMENEKTYAEVIHQVEQEKLLDFSGFEGGFDINDLHIFEERNQVTINIYEYVESKADVAPFKLTKSNFGPSKHINLLLLSNNNGHHIVLIRDISSFFGKWGSKRKNICPWCTQGYDNPDHLKKCKAMYVTGLVLPSIKGNMIRFKDFHKFLPPVYRMYTDLLYVNAKKGITVGGYGLVTIGPNGDIVDKGFFIGKNAMEKYLNHMLCLSYELKKEIACTNLPLPEMSPDEKQEFDMTSTCSVCNCEFSLENPKVRHHSHHIKGYKIAAVCQRDNLQIKAKFQIPLFSPTQTKLGSHLILQNLKSSNKTSIHVIPKSNESFISVILGNRIKLVDTRKFLDNSLQDLIKNYVSSGNHDKLAVFHDDLDIDILKEEFYFPHTWFTSMDLLQENSLPPPKDFNDILADKDIGAIEYQNSRISLYQTTMYIF